MSDLGSEGTVFPVAESFLAIQEANNSIADNRDKDFLGWLDLMPLDKLSKGSGDKLLAIFLAQIWKYQRISFINLIFTAWERVYPKEERIPFYVVLFTINLIPVDVLKFIIKNIKNVSFLEVMNYLISSETQEIYTACLKTLNTFGPQPYFTLLTLQEAAEHEENAVVYNFLTSQIRKISPYAKIPVWVKDFTTNPVGDDVFQPPADKYGSPMAGDKLLPSYQETIIIPDPPTIDLPPPEKMVSLLLKGFKKSGVSEEDVYQAENNLISELTLLTREEKFEKVKPFLWVRASKIREKDSKLHRLYGPANPTLNPTVDEMLYGGERMFTSLIFDDDPTSENLVTDWFVGYCQECDFRIRRRWHAVRTPNESGGWIGCFCSWSCVKGNLSSPSSFDEKIDLSLIRLSLANQFEAEMIKFGVQDRNDNGDIFPDEDLEADYF
jgi:hypothetical protein